METNTSNNDSKSLEVEDNKLTSYEDLVAMVTQFQEQLQSLDYRVTNKNFGSKFYQTKEHINSRARLSAGSKDDVAIMDGQHPTYRLWIGAEDPADAPFTVDKNGNAVINSITLTGYIPTGGALTDIGAGNITGTYIASNAITTPKLSATAIDGMTITGALIRTSSSGGRVVLNDSTDALEVYDTSGVKRVVLDNDEITFLNSSAATRGGIIADTTEVYMYALNGGNLHLEAEGALYGVLIYAGGGQIGAFTTAGLGMDEDITMNGNDISMGGGEITGIDEIVFDKRTAAPNADGEMLHFDDGSDQSMRVQMNGVDYTFDLSFL